MSDDNKQPSDWTDFFKVEGEYAVRNLTVVLSMIVGSLCVLSEACAGDLGADLFAVYMLAGGGVYGFGKWQDEKTRRTDMEMQSPSPTQITTINQPEKVNMGAPS